jgi:FtsP/CotA-like multicopper oxidase with cupredoxin domain
MSCGSTPETVSSEVLYSPPNEVRSEGGVLSTDLRVAYASYSLGDAPVYLRSYNGKPVGPTLRARPGDTLKIKLINDLPVTADSPAEGGGAHSEHQNMPNGFNLTNLHTHGLWVSPADASDNVLLTINPGSTFDFEIAIPNDHPPGTHWYHTHRHGSTALQVSSGMAGMLIIEGGLDDVPEIQQATEQVLVFQQVSYDSSDCGDVLPADLQGKGVGCIESYKNFGAGAWGKLGRSTSVNGQISPTLKVRPGDVLRWRMVHAGVRESIHLALIRETADGNLPPVLPPTVDGHSRQSL